MKSIIYNKRKRTVVGYEKQKAIGKTQKWICLLP